LAQRPDKRRLGSGEHPGHFVWNLSCGNPDPAQRGDSGQRAQSGEEYADLFLSPGVADQIESCDISDFRDLARDQPAQRATDQGVAVFYSPHGTHHRRKSGEARGA